MFKHQSNSYSFIIANIYNQLKTFGSVYALKLHMIKHIDAFSLKNFGEFSLEYN